MTIEEKLDKAIDFIKKIESMKMPMMTEYDIVQHYNKLKDDAWHMLADIAN